MGISGTIQPWTKHFDSTCFSKVLRHVDRRHWGKVAQVSKRMQKYVKTFEFQNVCGPVRTAERRPTRPNMPHPPITSGSCFRGRPPYFKDNPLVPRVPLCHNPGRTNACSSVLKSVHGRYRVPCENGNLFYQTTEMLEDTSFRSSRTPNLSALFLPLLSLMSLSQIHPPINTSELLNSLQTRRTPLVPSSQPFRIPSSTLLYFELYVMVLLSFVWNVSQQEHRLLPSEEEPPLVGVMVEDNDSTEEDTQMLDLLSGFGPFGQPHPLNDVRMQQVEHETYEVNGLIEDTSSAERFEDGLLASSGEYDSSTETMEEQLHQKQLDDVEDDVSLDVPPRGNDYMVGRDVPPNFHESHPSSA